MRRIVTLTAFALVLTGAMAQAQVPPAAQPNTPPNRSGDAPVNDWLFAEAAALGGMAELQLSEVGIQKTKCDDLKNFSKQMIEDHTKLNQELTALAVRKRVTLPRTLDARAQFCAQSLSGLSDEQFDKCYSKAQLQSHMEALSAFEAEAQRGQDPDMKSFASRAVPHIKQHLDMIKAICEKEEKTHQGERKTAAREK